MYGKTLKLFFIHLKKLKHCFLKGKFPYVPMNYIYSL
jgi:hypothetical protein